MDESGRFASVKLYPLADRPPETGELAGDRHHDLVAVDAARAESTKPRAQPQLRFPGNIEHRLSQPALSSHDDRAHGGMMAISPSGLHQRAACRAVAGLGFRVMAATTPRGSFARDQAQVGHERARMHEAG